jgi:glycogen(starch) synthase
VRILTWCYAFWPGQGGLERIVPQLTLGLADRGHEVLVITQTVSETLHQYPHFTVDTDPEDASWNRLGLVDIHRVSITSRMDHHDAVGLARVAAEVRAVRRAFAADVVHVAMCGRDGLIALKTDDGTPWVLSSHISVGVLQGRGSGVWDRQLERADRILAVSEAARRETVALVPHRADRIRVVHNGVVPTVDAAPLPEGPPVILAHGRLVPEKGFAPLLVAFALLLDRQPDARLVIAGDGYGRVGLQSLASSLGVSAQVDFTGWVDEARIRELIDASHVVAVPSVWNEPFGLTALEAAERGRPVVASRVGGLQDIIIDGETGLLVQAGDPMSFAAAIESLLIDPERATAMGAAARRRAHTEFTFERCLDGYEQALREVAR